MSEKNYPDFSPFFVCEDFSVRCSEVVSIIATERDLLVGIGTPPTMEPCGHRFGVVVSTTSGDPLTAEFVLESDRDRFRMHLESELGIVHQIPETTNV